MLQSTTASVSVLYYMWYSGLLSQYLCFWYVTVHQCPSTSPTDLIQSSTTPVSVLLIGWSPTAPVPDLLIMPFLLIWHSPLLSQYQSYWYNKVHNCHSNNLTKTTQSITAQVSVLPICYDPQLPQNKSYIYDTVHNCPRSTSPDSPVHYFPSTSLTDTILSTTDTASVLLIRHSPLMLTYQSCRYYHSY